MNMVERYLGSVAWQLPAATREDIVSELRDDILSRIEAVEAGGGAAATEKQVADILRATGHPATVAARYSGQAGLLPPEAVPWWWAHVRALAALIGVLYAAGALLSLIAGQPPARAIAQAFTQGMGSFLHWLGVLTLVYLGFVRFLYPKVLREWNPARLSPPDPVAERRPGMLGHAIGLTLGIAFLLWWTGAIDLAAVPEGLRPGPAWQRLYWPVLLLMVLGIARGLAAMFLPAMRRLAAMLVVPGAVGTIAIASYLLRNGPAVVLADGVTASQALAGMARGINGIVPIVLVIAMIANVFEGWSAARYLLRTRGQA